ncbi:hypothetical protein, partial [Kitasatospora sp. NPDC059803]|uniref:hypothetical protein n=1 Tax=Kitasatospora sp. NPDC059803 TaxID=3346953 RepID=UPI0036493FC7
MTKLLSPAPPTPARAGRLRPLTARPRRTGLSRLRLLAWPVYLTALVWFLRTQGMAFANDVVFLWLIGALLTGGGGPAAAPPPGARGGGGRGGGGGARGVGDR